MACPRKNTGASSSGFACEKRGVGTNRWTPIPPQANSTSCLMKRKVSRRRALFATGRLSIEVHRHPTVLGTLPGLAIRSSGSRRQELSPLATKPSASLAPFPALAGKRRSLQHSHRRSLPRPWQAGGRGNRLGLDRHALRLRPPGRLLSVMSVPLVRRDHTAPDAYAGELPLPPGRSYFLNVFDSPVRALVTVNVPLDSADTLIHLPSGES